MKKCLEEGTLQAYLDGELSQDAARAAAAHLADCAACAEVLALATDESAFFASAFAPDPALSVPTAELRARVNAAVARLEAPAEANEQRATGWNFGALITSFSSLFTLTPQRAAAFAGVAAVVVLATVFYANRPGNHVKQEIAGINEPRKVATPAPSVTPDNPTQGTSPTTARSNVNTPSEGARNKGSRSGAGAPKRKGTPFTPVPASREGLKEIRKLVPGESDYQTTIANLDRTIKANGDAVLKPAVRSDYERNIAVLDRAIEETRQVALRNPKDKDARSFLFSAYQSKVELMTTVADSAQVATLEQ